MHYEYQTEGTCSRQIIVDIDEQTHIIDNVEFVGGCAGNTLGVSKLVRGQKAEEVIDRLEGTLCGLRPTSCPDQLARALRKAIAPCIVLIALLATSCQESKTARLEREARELTDKNCPQRITPDGTVILDSIVFHDDGSNELNYYYHVNTDADGIFSLQMQKTELERSLLSGINNSIDLRHVKEMGVSIVHHYNHLTTDSLGNESSENIFTFRFTKDDYK